MKTFQMKFMIILTAIFFLSLTGAAGADGEDTFGEENSSSSVSDAVSQVPPVTPSPVAVSEPDPDSPTLTTPEPAVVPGDTASFMGPPSAVAGQQGASTIQVTTQKQLPENWWVPEKPYDLWKKDQLEKWITELENFRVELQKEIAKNQGRIQSVDEQIDDARKILNRII